MKKLSSLTIFFPFYNDEGTVKHQIEMAYKVGASVASKLEVIAIHGGPSKDKTLKLIRDQKKAFPNLVILDKSNNSEGYAVIKHGFSNASKDWVYYTDGDAQYHLEEDLPKMVGCQFKTNATVVNGYKVQRSDSFVRTIAGTLYSRFSRYMFELPIKDTDCDSRLINTNLLKKITLESTNASILPELVKKLELAGAQFAEVPVIHYPRTYGTSNYTAFELLTEKLLGDTKLYFRLRKYRTLSHKWRVIRFMGIGAICTLFQYLTFNLILTTTTAQPYLAVIIADQISIILSFFLNNKYTFTDTKVAITRDLPKVFLRFYATVMISVFIQAGVVYIGTYIFGTSIIVSNIFWIIGLVFAFMWNYLIQSRLIWAKYKH